MKSNEIYTKIKYNFDHIAKPIDSLGEFEELICRIGAIQNTEIPDLSKRALIIMCADNGIVNQGISQSGQDVTYIVAANMGKQSSSAGIMASCTNVVTIPVDIGMASDDTPSGVLDYKIRRGTRDFAIQKAMTDDELNRALNVGSELVTKCKNEGFKILATGEMGIGNTTTSASVSAALLKVSPDLTVGRGAGLDDVHFAHKLEIVKNAINKYDLYNADVLEILRCVGGLDIAGMIGIYLGCAKENMPVVIDGVISAVAALAAVRINSDVRKVLIPSHSGKEPAMKMILNELELTPVIDGNLALGEGSGAIMLFPLLDMVLKVYLNGCSFKDIGMDDYTRYELDTDKKD